MATILPLPDERDRKIKGIADSPASLPPSDDPLAMEEQADGSVVVDLNPKKTGDNKKVEFDANLAESIDPAELAAITHDLMRRIEQDKEARRKRDEQYAEGLKRTGISEDAPGGASFTGASRATHPILAEACIDFSATAMKELFPPAGPCRTNITGNQTPEKLAIAERQYKYMNWYLTKKMIEYREEMAQTTTQLAMAGSEFVKFWPDYGEGRIRCEFVPCEDLLLPYGTASFWAASRITHVQRLSENQWEERVEMGMYVDPELAPPGMVPETTKAGEASERIEGVAPPAENLEGLRLVYETNTYLKLSVDGKKRLPYLISIDERNYKIVGLYRNWQEKDRHKKRLHWIADYAFIPWRGAYKQGFAQLIGGLSSAATGSLRALLDSALMNTIPVLAKMKGVKFGAQTKSVEASSAVEVEAGTTIDDIRKAMMPIPFNQPSPVLFQLLGFVVEAAKGLVSTADEKIADINQNAPVGTTLALIEQGSKVFSSIHAGLHYSQMKAFEIIARLLPEFMDDAEQIEEFGEVIARPEDFLRPLGVIPVSDPNIFSEGQRFAQMQLVGSYAFGADPKTGQPTSTARLHNPYKVLKRIYEQAKIPNIDEFLPPPQEPTELNSAAENTAVMLGQPVRAFPEQDHLAHLESHARFIVDPLFGGNPAAVPTSYPQMVEHIKQHLALLYAKTMHDIASAALGQDIGDLMQDKQNWPKLDKVLAAASRSVHVRLTEILQPLGPEIMKIVQQIEKMKPPAPMDPSQAALQVAKLDDQRERDLKGKDVALKAASEQEKARQHDDKMRGAAEERELKAAAELAEHGREGVRLETDIAAQAHQQAEEARHREHERQQAEEATRQAGAGQILEHDRQTQAQQAQQQSEAARLAHERSVAAADSAHRVADRQQAGAHFEATQAHEADQAERDREIAAQAAAERAKKDGGGTTK